MLDLHTCGWQLLVWYSPKPGNKHCEASNSSEWVYVSIENREFGTKILP